MSKFLPTNVIDEKGAALLGKTLSGPFFWLQSWDGNVADIDGQIRLRDGKEKYLNKYLHYQLKSVSKLKNQKFSCEKKVVKYLMETNVPTLLFVADIENQKVYWYFAKRDFQEDLESCRDNLTIEPWGPILEANFPQIQKEWSGFAKDDNYFQVSASLQKVINDYSSNVISCVGLLYIVQKISKKLVVDIFEKLLKITALDAQQIITKLHHEGVVTSTENLYIVENEQVGIESTYELLKKVSPERIFEVFQGSDERKIILRRMSEIKHPKIQSFFKALIKQASDWMDSPTSNDEMHQLLELIEEFSHKLPRETLKMLKKIIKANPVPPVILHKFVDKDLYGKDHEDLMGKTVELLSNIRYLQPKEIFPILVSLSRSSSKNVCSKANDTLKHFTQFNYHILRQIGYGVQDLLVKEIDRWSDVKLKQNREIMLIICEELLTPSFEGTTWNKDTMTLHSGPLNANETLKKIRASAIKYLKKLYHSARNINEQKAVLNCLHNAARTPDQGGASDALLELIYADIEDLIKFYDSLLVGAESEIIKEIEEHSYWLGRWHQRRKLKGLEDLRLKIASNTEFALFSVFVGYDARIARDVGWEEAKDSREEQICSFVKDISNKNYNEWKNKILKVLKNYQPINHGEYIYLGRFLNLFGQHEPKLALRMAKQIGNKLGDWLTYLIAGVWASNKKQAKKLLIEWIKEGKYLHTCVDVLGYENEEHRLDREVLIKAFSKAKKTKDKEALRSTIRIIFNNYKLNKSLKRIFIDCARELIKLKDTWWLNGIWTKKESIIDDLSSSEADVILDALMLLHNLEYHSEEIASSITKKYPKKIIQFFLNRVIIKANYRRNFVTSDFRAIPFDLNSLAKALKEKEDIILPLIIDWYSMGGKKNGWLFRWEASHFIEKIFENDISGPLSKHIMALIKSKDNEKLKAALSILANYKGGSQIWSVCKEIIKVHSKSNDFEKVRGSLMSILSDPGSVSGMDGFVIAYEVKKKEAVEEFEDDGIAEIIAFKKDYTDYLDKQIEFQRKRADEEIALRDRGLGW